MHDAPPRFAVTLAHRLVAVCDPQAVLMFGSWGKARMDVYSDLDVLVLLDRRPTPAVRAELVDATTCVPLKVDLLLWTAEDLSAAQSDPYGFRGSVLSSAVPLHVRRDSEPLVGQPVVAIGRPGG